MATADRDMQVVGLVARFGAMTARQIRVVFFAANRSGTPCDRVLARLLERDYLARYKWRYQPAARAGAAEYVYQLGANGWRFIGYSGKYKKLEAFDRHQLAIGDLFAQLVRFEHAGLLEVLEYETEPNNWTRFGHVEVRPDLFARIRTGEGVGRFWFEVDLGSEHVRQIREKIARYRHAYEQADGESEDWRVFPQVVFVAQTADGDAADMKRAAQLARWIGDMDRGLFAVCAAENLAAAIGLPSQGKGGGVLSSQR